MRKFLLWLSIPVLMTLDSCMREDIAMNDGEEVTASVTINLPGNDMQSRVVANAPADPGRSNMRLYLFVYENGEIINTIPYNEVNLSTPYEAKIRLITGKDYKIAAWADYGSTYYTVKDGIVTLADKEVTGNDTYNDAYYVCEDVNLKANGTVTLTLKRPFGLIQVTTTDWAEPAVQEGTPTSYSTTINVPTKLTLLGGTVGDNADVTFKGGILDEDVANKKLSFDYIFANEEGAVLNDFTMDYDICTYDFENIPIRRNYITNITGNVLTKEGALQITVDQNWAGELLQVATAADFMEAFTNAENGDVIELSEDITLSQGLTMSLEADESVVIDLNGKTLSFTDPKANDITVNSGTLFVRGGKINAGQKSKSTEGGFVAAETGTVVLEEVDYTTNGCVLFVADEGKGVIRNSTVKAGAYAVTSNAGEPDQNIVVTLEGSTFTASTPILLNVPSTITVDACTITGDTQGMVVRGGTATISNSTITLIVDDSGYESFLNYFNTNNWGTGNMVNCAALTIGNKAPNAYQYPTNVTLKNTELKLGGAYGSYFPALYAYANSGEGLGVTLTFDESCDFAKEPEYGSTNITVNGVSL